MKRLLAALALAIPSLLGLSADHVGAASARAGAFAPFTGSWYHHGIHLDITAAGHVYAAYRTYVWCSATRRFACDRISGNQIYDGGLWIAFLNKPGGTTVTGTVVAASDPALDGKSIRLVRQPHDFLVLSSRAPGWSSSIVFCGPKAPANNKCGA